MRPLVVVSYYDRRPLEPLAALLGQIDAVPAGAPFDLRIVVNATGPAGEALAALLEGRDAVVRPNAGYNIGAWQAGWVDDRDHDFFLFLQDDCVIAREGWLRAFMERAREPDVGLVGEAEFVYYSWDRIRGRFRAVWETYQRFIADNAIPDDYDPTHIQMTAVGARRAVLEAVGGFYTGDSRAEATAGEIGSNVRLLHAGFRNVQVAWLPYFYVSHAQWGHYIAISRRWIWSAKRVVHNLRWIWVYERTRGRRLRRTRARMTANG